uniref:Uncharacterized protein n=1 Tax=Zea mays TaxID=4577 RepID=A0A804LNV7_MAIZE
ANQPSWSPSPLKQSNLLRARSSTCSPPLPCSSRPPPPPPPLTPHPAQSTRRGPRPCPHLPAPPKIDHPINRLLVLTPDPFPWIAPPPTTAAVPVAPPPPAARTRTSASTSSAAPSARPRRRRPRSHSPPQTALPSPSRRSTTSARTSSATSSSSSPPVPRPHRRRSTTTSSPTARRSRSPRHPPCASRGSARPPSQPPSPGPRPSIPTTTPSPTTLTTTTPSSTVRRRRSPKHSTCPLPALPGLIPQSQRTCASSRTPSSAPPHREPLPRRRRLQLQLRDSCHTLTTSLHILIPRLYRRLGYSLPQAASSTCSRPRPGHLIRYSRQGFSTRRRSRRTSPRCLRWRGPASLAQDPCRRRRRRVSGSRSRRLGSFLHQASCRALAQGGEIYSKSVFSTAAAPLEQGGRVTFDGRDVATVRSVGSSAGFGWRNTQFNMVIDISSTSRRDHTVYLWFLDFR